MPSAENLRPQVVQVDSAIKDKELRAIRQKINTASLNEIITHGHNLRKLMPQDDGSGGEGSVDASMFGNKQHSAPQVSKQLSQLFDVLANEMVQNLLAIKRRSKHSDKGTENNEKESLQTFSTEGALLSHLKSHPEIMGLGEGQEETAAGFAKMLEKNPPLMKEFFNDYKKSVENLNTLLVSVDASKERNELNLMLSSIPRPKPSEEMQYKVGMYEEESMSRKSRKAVSIAKEIGSMMPSMMGNLFSFAARALTEKGNTLKAAKEEVVDPIKNSVTSMGGTKSDSVDKMPINSKSTDELISGISGFKKLATASTIGLLMGGFFVPSIILPPIIPLYITYLLLSRVPGIQSPIPVLGSSANVNVKNPGTLQQPLIPADIIGAQKTEVVFDEGEDRLNTLCMGKCRKIAIDWFQANKNVLEAMDSIGMSLTNYNQRSLDAPLASTTDFARSQEESSRARTNGGSVGRS